MQPKIIFITGSSNVGKTTLVKNLKDSLPKEYEIYDFDELGVPPEADQAWRIDTTRKWLEKASENTEKGVSTIITGLTMPQEVMEAAGEIKALIKFFVLEVSQDELRKRLLSGRFSTPEKVANERMTLEEFMKDNRNMIEKIVIQGKKFSATFLDTTDQEPEKVAEELKELII